MSTQDQNKNQQKDQDKKTSGPTSTIKKDKKDTDKGNQSNSNKGR